MKRFLPIALVLLLAAAVHASPEITAWYNNATGDNSTAISVRSGDGVFFQVEANETVNWTWTLDGLDQGNDLANWSHTFTLPGTCTVGVVGTNLNGTTRALNWTVNVTVPPVITSWGNNKTGNASLAFRVLAGETVLFNASADQTITTWNWSLNGQDQGNNQPAWNYTFPTYGHQRPRLKPQREHPGNQLDGILDP
ncbi:MAG: hypothetical protein GXO65_00535 [Euryarchaeota archaeon]|nr:hypothetical protein [Euryarchaeota archaeon]